MSDLSERLRIHGKQRIREIGWEECNHIAVEAADRIEALEAELAQARAAALEEAANVAEAEGSDPSPNYKPFEDTHNDGWQDAAVEIATSIRALMPK